MLTITETIFGYTLAYLISKQTVYHIKCVYTAWVHIFKHQIIQNDYGDTDDDDGDGNADDADADAGGGDAGGNDDDTHTHTYICIHIHIYVYACMYCIHMIYYTNPSYIPKTPINI